MKNCSHPECKNPLLPETEEYFYKQLVRSKKKGDYYKLSSWCKECTKEKSRKDFKENKDLWNERNYQHYLKNKDTYHKRKREWLVENGDHVREYQRGWYADNPDRLHEYGQNRREHKTHDISDLEWAACKTYFNNECAYCGLHVDNHYVLYSGEPKKFDLSKEHVDYNGANDLSNCVPSCRSCNSSKWEFSLDEWYSENNHQVYTEERRLKIIKWLESDYKIYIESK